MGLPPTPDTLRLGCNYHLHSSHRFLSTLGAVTMLEKKKTVALSTPVPSPSPSPTPEVTTQPKTFPQPHTNCKTFIHEWFRYPHSQASPVLCFGLLFMFSIVHRSRRMGKAWEHLSHELCLVDTRWTCRRGGGGNSRIQTCVQ